MLAVLSDTVTPLLPPKLVITSVSFIRVTKSLISTFFDAFEADASPIISASPVAKPTLEPDVPASSRLISAAVDVTLVRSVGAIAILAEPSKETPAIVLAVVRVAALPVVF